MQEISLNILDLVQNSIKAAATVIEISVNEDENQDELTVEIKDNGRGMTREQLKKVTDPFFTTRTTRKVGLGVPLFKMAAEMTGGSFKIDSTIGKGTSLIGVFGLSHIDRMPLGNINETIKTLIYCNPKLDFVYKRTKNSDSFTLDTRELKSVLGDVSLVEPDVVEWIDAFLNEGEQKLCVQ